ncbi:MAG: glycoside hydrolase family 25 protein [Blastocatellia bacterium]|nr:glycoside hydrolase family 25 protein [Blastocatellia bacterium]
MINVVVDLSHFNNVSDFDTVKQSGIVGVIHKATQGTGYKDSTYQSRKPEALAAGLLWGAYHFGEGGDGAAQADFFLSFVSPEPEDLLVLDFEQNPQGGSMTIAEAEQFVTEIFNKTGRWPGMYGGSYLKELLGSSTNPTLANCWFWLAQYGSNAVVPANWPTWTMWQYTDGVNGPEPHSVPGIGNCDRDQFNGEMEELEKLWGTG